jgi:TPP-dependent 2-oxoacid decarboxylase
MHHSRDIQIYHIPRYYRKYNDISNWNWTGLFSVLGDPEEKLSRVYTVRNKTELSKLLDDVTFASADKIQLVEVMMDKLDAPRALQVQAELSGQTNAYDAQVVKGPRGGREEIRNTVEGDVK